MTCVLAVTPFHTNLFSEDGAELQNKRCDNFDFDWFNFQCVHSGLSKCSITCGKEARPGSTKSCQAKFLNNQSRTSLHEQCDARDENNCDADLKATEQEKFMLLNGKQEIKNQSEISEPECQKTTKQGVKRKADIIESEELYVASKRVSPFLNTPKERKDERKKILKISVKKLKQLDDPETFLRRTVLVNNTRKQLQMALRAENLRTKNRNYFSGYGMLNNSCLSDSYLIDDSFLSGAHEKITDDMTDTLINNVFYDTPNDRTIESSPEITHSVK